MVTESTPKDTQTDFQIIVIKRPYLEGPSFLSNLPMNTIIFNIIRDLDVIRKRFPAGEPAGGEIVCKSKPKVENKM